MVDLALLLPKFGMLQMLDEKDPNKWYVDITIKDAETGTTTTVVLDSPSVHVITFGY